MKMPWRITALPMPKLDALPVAFTLPPREIGGRRLVFELDYNAYNKRIVVDPDTERRVVEPAGDFYLTVWKNKLGPEENKVYRQKLVYGQDVFMGAQNRRDLLGLHIIPADLDMIEKDLTPQNFGKRVQLFYYYNPTERPW